MCILAVRGVVEPAVEGIMLEESRRRSLGFDAPITCLIHVHIAQRERTRDLPYFRLCFNISGSSKQTIQVYSFRATGEGGEATSWCNFSGLVRNVVAHEHQAPLRL